MGENTDGLPVPKELGANPGAMVEPTDVGDGEDTVPEATDLGYPETNVEIARNFCGDRILYDSENGDARVECRSDTFIEDTADWA